MYIQRNLALNSTSLGRRVTFDLVLPRGYNSVLKYPLLLMNDGQDFDSLGMGILLKSYWGNGGGSFVFVGLHCNKNRLAEYGTAGVLDFKGRGEMALNYHQFIETELLPSLHSRFSITSNEHVFCGFSLGGLSAFDIVWAKPQLFSKVGVFSGSFWWRRKDYGQGYREETDRILHQKVKSGKYVPHLRFWLECGTNDEVADRNKNGIIDSIDDTLDLIRLLEQKGYDSETDIHYEEVEGGEHNFKTWSEIMPNFLIWAFG